MEEGSPPRKPPQPSSVTWSSIRQSGGGITISGGDPLVQHEFALEVLGLCKSSGAHTAIETCLFGNGRFSNASFRSPIFSSSISKSRTARKHAQYTGRPNDLIFDNYTKLARAGGELLTRVPLIPGVTATVVNVQALARFVRETNPGGRVELVNFNPLAINKYSLMNRSKEFFDGMTPMPDGEVEALRAVFEAEGLAVVREHRRSDAVGK